MVASIVARFAPRAAPRLAGLQRRPALVSWCFGPFVRHQDGTWSHLSSQVRGLIVKTPSFGAESITEGTVMEWRVKVGDAVKKGDVLTMIETDKVTVEVLAEQAGTVTGISAKVDETVAVGAALCDIEPGAASVSAAPAPTATPPSAASPAKQTMKTPSFGAESITEGTILNWATAPGQPVKAGDVLVVIETDKVSVEVKAETDGFIEEIFAQTDTTVAVGAPLCIFASCSTDASTATALVQPTAASSMQVICPSFGAESITEGTVIELKKVGDVVGKDDVVIVIETDKVSVEVKAEESGAISEVQVKENDTVAVGQPLFVLAVGATATGTAAPAETAAAAATAASTAATAAPSSKAAAAASAPAPLGNREERRVKMTRMRQAIARGLKGAQNTMAMLTVFQEIDMSGAMAMRAEYKDLFEKNHGIKLGFQSVFIKASANALKMVPAVNARIDDATKEIVFRDYVDVAFAAASSRGLVTPVMPDVGTKSIKQIEASFTDLAVKAKNDGLTLEEMQGGTFMISNGGVFGSMLGTPMLSSSITSSAVLGVHATKMRPVSLPNGDVVAKPTMYVALTFDSRLIDTREATVFLNIIKEQVEDPRRLLVEL